jgi:hypothetical protein
MKTLTRAVDQYLVAGGKIANLKCYTAATPPVITTCDSSHVMTDGDAQQIKDETGVSIVLQKLTNPIAGKTYIWNPSNLMGMFWFLSINTVKNKNVGAFCSYFEMPNSNTVPSASCSL